MNGEWLCEECNRMDVEDVKEISLYTVVVANTRSCRKQKINSSLTLLTSVRQYSMSPIMFALPKSTEWSYLIVFVVRIVITILVPNHAKYRFYLSLNLYDTKFKTFSLRFKNCKIWTWLFMLDDIVQRYWNRFTTLNPIVKLAVAVTASLYLYMNRTSKFPFHRICEWPLNQSRCVLIADSRCGTHTAHSHHSQMVFCTGLST